MRIVIRTIRKHDLKPIMLDIRPRERRVVTTLNCAGARTFLKTEETAR